MKNPLMWQRGRFTLGLCVAGVLALLVGDNRASAQGQGVYVTQATARLAKLIDKANEDGFKLQNNSFSIGGGWLKKSSEWAPIYTVKLNAGQKYRFLASGDDDATDVDLKVVDAKNNEVAIDDDTARDAVVNYTPRVSGRYTVHIRLYASRNDVDAVCLSVMMAK